MNQFDLFEDIDCNSTHVFPRAIEDSLVLCTVSLNLLGKLTHSIFYFFCNALQIKFVQFIYLLEIDWGVMNPYLLPDSDVSLLDQDTCMVDGFCKPKLENLGLKTVPKYCVKS